MKPLETKSIVLLQHHLKALRLPTMHDEQQATRHQGEACPTASATSPTRFALYRHSGKCRHPAQRRRREKRRLRSVRGESRDRVFASRVVDNRAGSPVYRASKRTSHRRRRRGAFAGGRIAAEARAAGGVGISPRVNAAFFSFPPRT